MTDLAGQIFPRGALFTVDEVDPEPGEEAMIVTNPKPSGAPDAGWSVNVNGQPTWAHYTGRGAVATYSTDAAGPVAVTLTAPVTVTAAEVKLAQDGVWPPPTVSPVFAGNTVVFVLPTGFQGHAMVRINNALPASGWQSFCVVGALPIETDIPASGEVTHYFGPGVHTGGQINIASGATVYVASGALVKRRLVSGQVGSGAGQRSNIRIYGRGVVDTTNGYGPTDQGMGAGDFSGVAGLTFEGITYVSRYSWALAIYSSTNVLVDRARIYSCEVVNAADYSSEGTPDGVDFIGSSNVTVKRSMISASDDSSAIKGSKYGETGNSNAFLYEDLMLIQGGKSNATEIGYELGTTSVTNITYRRVYAPISWRDSVSYRTNVFGIHLVTKGTVDGVLYEDCRADEARNKDFDLFLSNFYFSGGFGSVSGDANRGYLRNITYRRVDFPGQKPVRIVAELSDPNYESGSKKITNVTFEGCTRGGVPLTAVGGDWTVTNVVNLTFPVSEDPPPDDVSEQLAAMEDRIVELEQQNAELASNLTETANDLKD